MIRTAKAPPPKPWAFDGSRPSARGPATLTPGRAKPASTSTSSSTRSPATDGEGDAEALVHAASRGRSAGLMWALADGRMSHWFRYPHPPNPTDSEQHFDVAAPPRNLQPGETIDLRLVATGGGSNPHASGEDLEVWSYLGAVQHPSFVSLREDGAAKRITALGVGLSHGGGIRERAARIPVPAIATDPFTVVVTMAGSNGAVPWGQWSCVVRWVYEAR